MISVVGCRLSVSIKRIILKNKQIRVTSFMISSNHWIRNAHKVRDIGYFCFSPSRESNVQLNKEFCGFFNHIWHTSMNDELTRFNTKVSPALIQQKQYYLLDLLDWEQWQILRNETSGLSNLSLITDRNKNATTPDKINICLFWNIHKER